MMKLILAVTILCNVGIAQGFSVSLVKRLKASTPTPMAYVFTTSQTNTSRDICKEYDACAFVEHDSKDERNSRVVYRDCDCPEGNECKSERDMLDDCAGDENCRNYMDSLSKTNPSLNRYKCRKIQSAKNYSTSFQSDNNSTVQAKFFVEEMLHIISEMNLLESEILYISRLNAKLLNGKSSGVKVDTITEEADYLYNILLYFSNDVAYLEKAAARMENLKVPHTDAFAYSKIDILKSVIQNIISETERGISFYSEHLRK